MNSDMLGLTRCLRNGHMKNYEQIMNGYIGLPGIMLQSRIGMLRTTLPA